MFFNNELKVFTKTKSYEFSAFNQKKLYHKFNQIKGVTEHCLLLKRDLETWLTETCMFSLLSYISLYPFSLINIHRRICA